MFIILSSVVIRTGVKSFLSFIFHLKINLLLRLGVFCERSSPVNRAEGAGGCLYLILATPLFLAASAVAEATAFLTRVSKAAGIM